MTFVHAEPYVMRDLGGRIQPVYEGLCLGGVGQGLRMPVEPYVFVVGTDGQIVASFELIVGPDEIRAAVRTARASRVVAGWSKRLPTDAR